MPSRTSDPSRDGGISSDRFRLTAALGAVYFIWGSTYLAIRVAIETLPPFLHAGVRFLVAGMILYGWARLRGAGRPTWSHWKTALLSGFLMLFMGNGAVVWAEQFVSSGMVSLIVATVVLWIVLLDWGFGRGKAPGAGVLFGIVWGFGGVVLLVSGSEIGQATPQHLLGGLLVLAGSGAWAAGSLITRYWELPRSAALGTGLQMLAGGAGLFVGGLLRGELGAVNLSDASVASVVALLYLIVFGSLIAFSAYIWLLQNTTPAVASTYAYVNPMVALLLGWALADEPLSPRTILAAFIILSGVMIIATRRTRGGPQERNKG
jgi:drug/metabolite transporter (DMT)-like permease